MHKDNAFGTFYDRTRTGLFKSFFRVRNQIAKLRLPYPTSLQKVYRDNGDCVEDNVEKSSQIYEYLLTV